MWCSLDFTSASWGWHHRLASIATAMLVDGIYRAGVSARVSAFICVLRSRRLCTETLFTQLSFSRIYVGTAWNRHVQLIHSAASRRVCKSNGDELVFAERSLRLSLFLTLTVRGRSRCGTKSEGHHTLRFITTFEQLSGALRTKVTFVLPSSCTKESILRYFSVWRPANIEHIRESAVRH